MTTSFNTLKHYPLSSSQREIWFDQILHSNIPLYNFGGYLRIDGPIDPALFEKALNQVIEENDALRIMLFKAKMLPTQVFAENVRLKLNFYDFSNEKNAERQAMEWMQREFVKPFQLYEGLLFQFALCKVSYNCYYWFKKYHHIIVDGWANSLIVQRVAVAYNALTGEQSDAEQTSYSYRDFIQNDQSYLESENFAKAQHYWREKYREVPEPLIVHRYAAQDQTIPSQRSTLHLKRPFFKKLIDFAKENSSSTFHLILGVLYCYFVRTYAREDLVIGLPTLNRSTTSFKQTVGLFTNVIPACFRFGTNLSFLELIQAIGLESRQGYPHRRFPIGEINRQLGLAQKNRRQLFDLILSYMNNNCDTHFAGSAVEMRLLTHGVEQNALVIFVNEFHKQREVKIDFDYNLSAFDEAEIERLKASFKSLLEDVLQRPHVSIQELNLMPEQELRKILFEFNDTAVSYSLDKTIIDLFEEQVERTPDAIALVFENKQLSYRELNQRANQLAHHLINLGVKPETLVGICIERSLEMVVGLLGILKAGGAYLPLEPTYPNVRLAFMLEDAQVSVLLTQEKLIKKLPDHIEHIICLDTDWKIISLLSRENPISGVSPKNLVYVIYTSGSTGKPKGVMNTHLGICNRLLWMQEAYSLTEADSVLQKTPFSFDVSVWEFFWPLLVGARLVVAKPRGHQDPAYLVEIIIEQKITTLHFVPSMLQIFVQASGLENCTSLKRVICSGEALSFELQERFFARSHAQLHNLYGPTEAAVDVTYWQCQRESHLNQVPIGRPIANTQIYILDHYLQPIPIGVPGELHIAGVGLARGYLNRSELTAEKFIPNPFNNDPKARLYKTGDLARYLPDGNIEYLGRIDNQVKMRGFRIELGEIETLLNQDSTVLEAVVIARDDESGHQRLIAYIVSKLILERLPLKTSCLVELDHQSPITLTTEDISCEGVCLVGVPQTLETGQHVRIRRLQLPDISDDQLGLEGHIAWCQGQRAGIQFAFTNLSTRVHFCQIIDNLFETQGIIKVMQRTSSAHLRDVLRQKLPDYMIPSSFIFLKAIPLTPNGKVDRKALPQLDGQRADLETAYLAPETEIEQKIARILQTVLQVNQVGIHDNFFELGGNSLLLVQVQEKLVEVLNREVPVLTLFQYPTINALLHYLEEDSPSEHLALKKSYDRAHKAKAAVHQFRKHHKAR